MIKPGQKTSSRTTFPYEQRHQSPEWFGAENDIGFRQKFPIILPRIPVSMKAC
jgi:hypothetical protein